MVNPSTSRDKVKLVWQVQAAPTGRYRSFAKRGWPTCHFGNKGGDLVATFTAERDYHSKDAESTELTMVLYDYRLGTQERKMARLKAKAQGLTDGKRLVASFFEKNSDWLPAE